MAEVTIIPYKGKGEEITREEAIEWFTILKEKFVNTAYEEYLEMAIKALEREPKMGRWVGTDEWYHKCSECEEVSHFRWYEGYIYKWCPYCGAKMVEPQESEV